MPDSKNNEEQRITAALAAVFPRAAAAELQDFCGEGAIVRCKFLGKTRNYVAVSPNPTKCGYKDIVM
jgi:hypothetical protein